MRNMSIEVDRCDSTSYHIVVYFLLDWDDDKDKEKISGIYTHTYIRKCNRHTNEHSLTRRSIGWKVAMIMNLVLSLRSIRTNLRNWL